MVNLTTYNLAAKIAFLHSDLLYLSLMSLMLVSFSLFLFFMAIMLSVYFSSSRMQEEARYILFVHMLITDTIYLIVGLLLFFTISYLVYYPVPICYIIVTMSSTAFKVTPYNLAVMSLERYLAICFPLRHTEWCNRPKAILTILAIWIIGLIPNVVDFIILCFSVRGDYFFMYCLCTRSDLQKNEAQQTLRSLIHVLGFSLVGLIIIFTYIKIMLVAIKVDSGKATASKAGRTVVLHAFQLLLCMSAYSYNLIEAFLRKYLYMLPLINFFFFMCLPRLFSPLIYGLRDEMFLRSIKRIVLCRHLKTLPTPETN
ncbi:odorant receptor 131-2-like [Engystomops pustulosus]|uniref:odorant receptor 131-2-like n=1 Tax=Engystomops pustulosus TaxID=76066 RepID=UPI003AFB3CB9